MSIQHFTTIDSSKTRSCWVTDKCDTTIHIFAKISRDTAREHLAHLINIRNLRSTLEDIIKSKPKVKRGIKCDSINSGYGIMGVRPDRNGPNNGTYAFKKKLPRKQKPNWKSKHYKLFLIYKKVWVD